jgi:hypothetical protein
MEKIMFYKKIQATFLVLLACLMVSNVAVAGGTDPDATITIDSTTVALGFGVSWGQGTLKYKGKTYKVKVTGLSVVDLGVSKVSATGNVYHLDHLSDIAGTYYAASAGIDIGGGVGAVGMENENDVVIKLTSTKAGVQFTLATEGVRIKLEE